MQAAKQFTRNADNFYLQVELHLDLHPHSLSFLLASTNEEEFYELNLTASPAEVRHVLPTLNHFFLYLLKNHNHPKAFRIDAYARIHVAVPTHSRQINLTLHANRITRDSIVLEDFIIQEDPEVFEVKAPHPQQGSTQVPVLAPFFGKKKKRDSQTYYLDLQEETPRSQSATECKRQAKKEEEEVDCELKNREICQQVENLLRKGINMGEIKQQLRLTDRSAWKMLQQFQKCQRIFSPGQTKIIRKNRHAKKLLQLLKQENPKATPQTLSQLLLSRGVQRSKQYIEEWLSSNMGSLIYYEESQSAGSQLPLSDHHII